MREEPPNRRLSPEQSRSSLGVEATSLERSGSVLEATLTVLVCSHSILRWPSHFHPVVAEIAAFCACFGPMALSSKYFFSFGFFEDTLSSCFGQGSNPSTHFSFFISEQALVAPSKQDEIQR